MLISNIFGYQNHRDFMPTGRMAQNSGHTAHTIVTALIGIAYAGMSAGRVQPQALGVGRAGMALDACNGRVHAAVYQLLLTDDQNNLLWTKEHTGYPVAAAINVNDFAVLGDRVGGSQINIRMHSLSRYSGALGDRRGPVPENLMSRFG